MKTAGCSSYVPAKRQVVRDLRIEAIPLDSHSRIAAAHDIRSPILLASLACIESVVLRAHA